MDNVAPQPGNEYKVNHSRKGIFTMRVDSVDGEWAHGVITGGHARYISEDDRHQGEKITIRIELANFYPL